jgi:hypothetical protein
MWGFQRSQSSGQKDLQASVRFGSKAGSATNDVRFGPIADFWLFVIPTKRT